MSKDAAALVRSILHRKRGSGEGSATKQLDQSRNSVQTIASTGHEDSELGLPIGRQNHSWPTPDDTRGAWFNNYDPGHRLQDFANSHLSEGPNPGRIPHFWNNRNSGKIGRNITGNPSGDQGLALEITGVPSGGVGDGAFILHNQIPRGVVVARAFQRTVDDAANIPGVYVSDPTRR